MMKICGVKTWGLRQNVDFFRDKCNRNAFYVRNIEETLMRRQDDYDY